jgi:hypothetical protein
MCQYSKIYPHPKVKECGGSSNNYGTEKNLEKLMKNGQGTGRNVVGKERENTNSSKMEKWTKIESGSIVDETLANRVIKQYK